MECAKEGCETEAAFELHIPWADNHVVCAGHARVESQKDGIVAQPLDTADETLPDGATDA